MLEKIVNRIALYILAGTIVCTGSIVLTESVQPPQKAFLAVKGTPQTDGELISTAPAVPGGGPLRAR